MKNIREIIGDNLASLRKEKKLTQLEIAEKFNYSDKAVSKWEKGDTIPDIETLNALAEFYGVTLDYLTHEGTREEKAEFVKKANKSTKNRIANCALTISIVWLIATIVFVYGCLDSTKGTPETLWVSFIWALPFSALMYQFFNKKYFGNKPGTIVALSFLIWTLLTAIYLTAGVAASFWSLWALFILGIPLQVSLILWINTKK